MFIRPCYRQKDGKQHVYWALMESYRTERGPRQRVVAYLGQLDEEQRLGVREAAEGTQGLRKKRLFDDVRPQWVEVDVKRDPLAQRGYSRDHRPDYKQVCIGLVVSRCGMPLGYEVFAGNRPDVTTLQEIVETMERRYGPADRIWVGDRGMVSAENIAFLKRSGRRYIIGTPKSMLRQFERELLAEDWHVIRDGLEVKLCRSPDGDETFVLCRSRDRREKEKAMHDRFERRIEEGLERIETTCRKQRLDPLVAPGRVGRLLGQNSRAAFRIHKSDLALRPIWHQREDRGLADILVCFLAYVLWKTLAQMCQQAGLGHEPRRVFEELGRIQMVDVILPTRHGPEIRRRCVTKPTDHQAILLARLKLNLPAPGPLGGL